MVHPIFVVSGPAGSGKSTVAEYIAQQKQLPFLEGDSLHPQSNIDKMSHGIPLQDADRWPWLETLREEATAMARKTNGAVVTCSSLKRAYREVLSKANMAEDIQVFFIFLQVSHDELLRRMETRTGHYMKKEMLESQLRDLQLPSGDEEDCHLVDANKSLEATEQAVLQVVDSILRNCS